MSSTINPSTNKERVDAFSLFARADARITANMREAFDAEFVDEEEEEDSDF